MPKDLTEEQKNLFNDLDSFIKGTGTKDIVRILEEAKTEDLFTVFKLPKVEKGDEDSSDKRVTLLSDLLSKNKICESAVFDMVKKRNILKEFLSIYLVFIESANGISENYKMVDVIARPPVDITEFLDLIKDKFGLEEFVKALSEVDYNIIKNTLERKMGKLEDGEEKSKCQGWLKEIAEIECGLELNSIIRNGSRRFLDMGNESESRKEAAKKGMKFGAITALAVGLGLYFGTGASLTVLPTIIGIALFAALVGATIGAITYDILKPKSCVDTVLVFKEFDTIKQEANTAAM